MFDRSPEKRAPFYNLLRMLRMARIANKWAPASSAYSSSLCMCFCSQLHAAHPMHNAAWWLCLCSLLA